MNNIVLIGMPACGKSTIGVVLAKTMGKKFVDTDLLIQEREGKLLQVLIDINGNDYFKRIEEYVLRGLYVENTIISTGGSAIYYPEAMRHFKEGGIIVYIKLPVKVIEERLDNIKTRGITLAPGQTIGDLYDERIPLYEDYADLIIEGEGKTVEEIVEEIILIER